YRDAASVKSNFLDRIQQGVERKLGRPVELYIEKEKTTTGDIHSSMFKEAVDADVYIADLTNANPNVYLELGVRWALRDGLTIPIYQNSDDLRFNVGNTRGFQYTPDNINQQVDALVDTIVAFQAAPWPDSPVRDRMALVTLTKAELDALRHEIVRLRESRGEDLYRAAMSQAGAKDAISLLEQAVAGNPAFTDAWQKLGVLYRENSRYEDAEAALLRARELDPGRAHIHRELGVTYSKSGKIQKAIGSLRDAVERDATDPEAWSNLGGALRRNGMRDAPAQLDRAQLEEARASYQRAVDISRYDLYAALNVSRLDLVLARWDSSKLAAAVHGFQTKFPLCLFEVNEKPTDYWRRFDLAEATLFTRPVAEALHAYREAIAATPEDKRSDTLRSVREPLRGYLAAGILPDDLGQAVQGVLDALPGTN
ncbi:MAG: tetratricopeptide repeat protein, partial [Paracraurococcus sp.]